MLNLPKISRVRDTVSLAGWLFADLLLGLAMLFLVFNTVGEKTTPLSTHTPSPSSSPTSSIQSQKTAAPNLNEPIPQMTVTKTKFVTPLPEVTATAQIGLDLTPSLVTVSVDSQKILNGDLDEIEALRSQIRYKIADFRGKRVGLVITLGYHRTVAGGMSLARLGNEVLLDLYPEIFDRSVMKPFWYSLDDNHPTGTITFEIYFFTIINTP
jgi:hypothetical protein